MYEPNGSYPSWVFLPSHVSGWRFWRRCPNLAIERKGRRLITNSSPRLMIKNGTLIDGCGRDPITNSLIVVEGNRISHVGHAEESMRPVNPDDRTIDATGKFILPSLIDAHCHISRRRELAHGSTAFGLDKIAAAPD